MAPTDAAQEHDVDHELKTRVVIVGGGVVGLEVARRLSRRRSEVATTVIDLDATHVYRPLLPEVASGVLEPRHAVVSLRAALPHVQVINGEAVALEGGRRELHVQLLDGTQRPFAYDHLVVAPGSVTKVLPVPGLVDRAVGFQTVGEALYLRDRLLDRFHLAETTRDPRRRRRALTFVFVGGGYSGVEAVGELNDLALAACPQFAGIEPRDLRFVLVEGSDRLLPSVGPSLRHAVRRELESRQVDIRLGTVVDAVDGHDVRLSDGSVLGADTIVWCAGTRPDPMVERLGLPTNDGGAIEVDADLAVQGHPGVWAAGDAAAVPDLIGGGTCPPSAQYALRQGRRLARNILRVSHNLDPKPFRYRQLGELVSIGRYSGVGEIMRVRLSGRLPWLLRAAYHVVRVPTVRRKASVLMDWSANLALKREIISLGGARDPDLPLERAAHEQDAVA